VDVQKKRGRFLRAIMLSVGIWLVFRAITMIG
jgi:hypothetical protein